MKRFYLLLLIFIAYILTGCTDIRDRRYAELMQISDENNLVELRCYDEKECWKANADSVKMIPAALEQTCGMELSFGHLSLLMLTEEKLSALPLLISKNILVPTCPVLLCDAPLSLEKQDDIAARYDAAIRTGALPRCTLGDIVGDFSYTASTRTTLIPYWSDNDFHLAVCDDSHIITVLSEYAQCGAAILCSAFQTMYCPDSNGGFSIFDATTQMQFSEKTDGIALHISTRFRTDAADTAAAMQTVSQCLTAFFQEAVCTSGCDVCHLYEIALQDGIPPLNAQQLHALSIIVSCSAVPENRPLSFP